MPSVLTVLAACALGAAGVDLSPPASDGVAPATALATSPAGTPAAGPAAGDSPAGVRARAQGASSRPAPARVAIAAAPLPGVRARCPVPGAMTTRALLAQTLMIGVEGRDVAQVRRLGTGAAPVGALFLSGTSTTVLRSGVLRDLHRGTLPPLVAVDEEGGRVQRIDAIAGSIPAPAVQARRGPDGVRSLARTRGRQLAALGVDVDLAPVVDLRGGATLIGDRAYGTSPAAVVDLAGAFAAGLRDAGVLPAVKHFPGHGRAVGDSHRGAARAPSLTDLRAHDLRVYPPLLDDGPALVMVGHLVVPGLSSRSGGRALPTSLDPAAYRLLRTEFRFEGVAVTDELSMRAVSDRFDAHAAVLQALRAGADLALLNVAGTGTSRVTRLLGQLEADVRTGRLPVARVREAASRVMAVKGCG